MLNNYYVYMYIRLDQNVPFYIGASNSLNFKRAYNTRNRTKAFKEVYSKTQVMVDIVSSNLSKEEAEIKETKLIALYGCMKYGGLLVNFHRNMPLKKHTEATKIKISKKHLGKKASKETRYKLSESKKGEKNPNYGKKHNEDYKENISKKLQGRIFTKETKEKMKAAWILRKQKNNHI